jgi:hypothetical protein
MIKIKILYFTMGVVTCFVGLFSIGLYSYYIDPYTMLKGHPKKFGDIKIAAFKPDDLRENKDVDETLMMTKDNIPFFYAFTNKSGKVTDIAVLGLKKEIRFTLFASEKSPSGWQGAMYGCGRGNYSIGDKYIDINFDGQFDVKNSYDNKGTRLAKYIYVDNDWKMVDSAESEGVSVGGIGYFFNFYSGWLRNDVNLPDKSNH